jgi:hypothetical protein
MRKLLLTVLTLFLCTYIHAEETDAIYVWVDGESTCYKLESMPKITFGNGTAILTLSSKTTPELTIPITDNNNLKVTFGVYQDHTTTRMEGIKTDSKVVKNGKYISGGRLIIVKDGKKYDASGNEITF